MQQIDWQISRAPIGYNDAVEQMEQRVLNIYEQNFPELIWFLEHPSIYTAGSSARIEELLEPDKFPVFHTGRGGKFTYHGPGQLVCYVMLNLKRRPGGADIRKFITQLEQVLIATLCEFGIVAFTREDRVGIWVEQNGHELKIAAIGIRIRKWVTYHGIALNINPNLDHFKGIIACGLNNYGVTSFANLGKNATPAQVIDVLKLKFQEAFCPI